MGIWRAGVGRFVSDSDTLASAPVPAVVRDFAGAISGLLFLGVYVVDGT